MTTVVFRTDADQEIGFGHITRSLSVADALTEYGHEPVFVTSRSGSVKSWIAARRDYDVLTFGKSESETEKIFERGPGLVVFDVRDTEHKLMAAVKEVGCFIVTFEDLGEGRYLADLVIDSNLTEKTNPKKMETKTRYLLGPDYAVISDECQKARKGSRQFGELTRILLSFGGSDPAGITPNAVRALAHLNSDIDIELITGPAFAQSKALGRALLEVSRNFLVVDSPPDFPTRLRSADLGIISGGVTLCEAAYLGLPTIVIAQNKHQLSNAEPFAQNGGVVSLGQAGEDAYGRLLPTVKELADPKKREEMSHANTDYIDGKGIDRIANEIKELIST